MGNAIAKGGRYDNLLEKFGKPSPATGCVVMIDDRMTALVRQNLCPEPENKNLLLVYQCDIQKAIEEARKYREEGYSTVMMKQEKTKEDYEKYAESQNFAKVLFLS